MSAYQAYLPEPEQRLPKLVLEIRPALPGDVPALAALVQQRHGGDLARISSQLVAELDSYGSTAIVYRLLFVAIHAGSLAGFARLMHTDKSERYRWPAPPGWYGMGLVVDPQLRRRGVATALAAHRFAWLQARQVPMLYSFANSRNLSSVAYHQAQGFCETGRAAGYLDVDFDGGEGILFVRQL